MKKAFFIIALVKHICNVKSDMIVLIGFFHLPRGLKGAGWSLPFIRLYFPPEIKELSTKAYENAQILKLTHLDFYFTKY